MSSNDCFPTVQLGSLVEITSGKRNSSEAISNGRFPFFTCGKDVLRIDLYEHDREAVLLGGNNANAVFPVFYTKGKFTARQRVYVIWSADTSRFDNRYLYFVLSHLTSSFTAKARGTTTLFITLPMLKELEVPLPSIERQQQIVEVLSALDDRITLLRETNVTLEAIAQTLFKSWFVDFDPVRAKQEGRTPEGMSDATAALFPDSFEESELGLVPKGWVVAPVGDAVETVGGGTPDTKDESYWQPAEFCWTTPKDLSAIHAPVLLDTERKLSTKGVAKISSGLLPAGTLLMSSRAPIGYLAITQAPMAINQGYIAMPPGGTLPPLYMLFWCRQNMETIKNHANGSTFMEISKKAFRPLPALVPPAELVAEFSAVADSLFGRLIENERQAQTLATLRDTLLPRLISGQLRLPEAEAVVDQECAA